MVVALEPPATRIFPLPSATAGARCRPTFIKSTTSVNVRDKHTIVLGGLITESNDKNTSGTPFLSRIPAVGNLFKRNTSDIQRKELIIFIQPTVITSDSDLTISSAKEDYRTKIGADAAERFPEDVNIHAARTSEAADMRAEDEAKRKQSIFSRMFSRKVKKAEAPPSLRR